MHLFSEGRIKITRKTGQTRLPGTALKSIRLANHRNMCKQKRDVPMQKRSNKPTPFYFKKYRFRAEDNIEAANRESDSGKSR